MLKDSLKGQRALTAVSKVKIAVLDRRQWVMYRQPTTAELSRGAFNLYLTDAQITKVGRALGAGIDISAVRISPDMVKSGAIAFE
jgi:hypothetical protein